MATDTLITKSRKVLVFLIPRAITTFIGLMIFAAKHPGMRPRHASAENLIVNSAIVWGVIVFVPVAFTLQAWNQNLRIIGWLLLCLLIAIGLSR